MTTEPDKMFVFAFFLQSQGYRFNDDLITLLNKKDFQNAVTVIMKNTEIRSAMVNEFAKETKESLKSLCKRETKSVLRGQNKELLENFSLKTVAVQLENHLNLFWGFLMGTVADPKQDSNKRKKGDALLPQFLSASASLIHVFNRDMNVFQCVTSLIMFKGGCKKSKFNSLNAISNCLSNRATLDMTDRLASGWEKQLLEWKSEVEMSVSVEEALQRQIETLDETIDIISDYPVCEVLITEREQLKV